MSAFSAALYSTFTFVFANCQEMKCDTDYYIDKNTLVCSPCKDICDPNRAPTKIECQLHCSAYLLKLTTSTFAADDLQQPVFASQKMKIITFSCMVLLASVILIGFFIIISISILKRKKQKLTEKMNEPLSRRLQCSSFSTAPYDHYETEHSSNKTHILTSLCTLNNSPSTSHPNFISDTANKPRSLSRRLYLNSLEVESKYSDAETQLKETVTTPLTYLNFNEAESRERGAETQLKETVTTPLTYLNFHEGLGLGTETVTIHEQGSPYKAPSLLDLQEDYDYVEQGLIRTKDYRDNLFASTCSLNSTEIINLRVTALLQRVTWVKQFWWDTRGAKVAVDNAHRQSGVQDIKRLLRREGIPSGEFSFELVSPLTVS